MLKQLYHLWMTRLSKPMKNKVFIKILIMFIIGMSVPALVSGMLSVHYATEHSVRQISKSNVRILEEKKLLFDKKLMEVDKMVNQMINDKNVWGLMTASRIEEQQLFMMKDTSKLLNTFIGTDETIDSIYVFVKNHNIVIADSKYLKDQFFDQDIYHFTLPEGTSGKIIGPRKIEGRGDQQFLTYLRKFEFSSGLETYFYINLNPHHFFEEIASLDMIVLDSEDNIIFSALGDSFVPEKGFLTRINDNEMPYENYIYDNRNFFINKIDSSSLGWTFLYVQDYTKWIQPAKLLRNTIQSILIIVLMISVILAFVLSRHLYKPLAKLVLNMKKHVQTSNLVVNQNEYKLIDLAMENIHAQNHDLTSKYAVARPYLQRYSIPDILESDQFSIEEFTNILELLGVEFTYSRYCTAIIDTENTGFTETVERKTEDFFTRHHPRLLFILSVIGHGRALIILNTDQKLQSIYHTFVQLQEMLRSEGTDVTISLGKLFDNLTQIPEHFLQTTEQMENKFFIGKNEILYDMNAPRANIDIIDDDDNTSRLLRAIKAHDEQQALLAFTKLKENYTEHSKPIQYVKYLNFQICSQIISTLLDLGIHLADTELNRTQLFKQIESVETILDLNLIVSNLISESIVYVGQQKKRQHTDLVLKAKQYIEANYNRDITLEDVAKSVYLSPRYLGSIFKIDTGMTIYDYITKLRLSLAKKLLIDTNMKIQDISVKVGYNTVQSFMRLFKKHCSLTPVEYRRKHM